MISSDLPATQLRHRTTQVSREADTLDVTLRIVGAARHESGDSWEMSSLQTPCALAITKAAATAFVTPVTCLRQNVVTPRPCLRGTMEGVSGFRAGEQATLTYQRISILRSWYAQGLGLFAQWLGQRFLLDKVEVDGIGNWMVGTHAAEGRGMVILPTHTDLNRDPVVLLNLLRFASTSLPRSPESHADHLTASIVAREPRNLVESLVLGCIARPFVLPIRIARGGETLSQTDRQKTRETLRRIVPETLMRGEHATLFPQGTTYGSGEIAIRTSGGTRALARYTDERPVPMLPMGITYETLGTKKPRAFVAVGQPFCVFDASRENALNSVLQAELLALNTITASGLSGLLLMVAQSQTVLFTKSQFTRHLASISDAIQEIPEISMDERLLDEERHSYFHRIHDSIVQRGYFNEHGEPQSLHDLRATSTRKGHTQYPLEFAGRRLLLQAQELVPLRFVLINELTKIFGESNSASPHIFSFFRSPDRRLSPI